MDNKSKFGTLVLIKRGLIASPKYTGISIQVGAEIYRFDSVRGENKGNFVAEEISPQEYLVEEEQDEDEEESQEESESNSSNQDVPVNENEIEESSSPQLRNRPSIESQQPLN